MQREHKAREKFRKEVGVARERCRKHRGVKSEGRCGQACFWALRLGHLLSCHSAAAGLHFPQAPGSAYPVSLASPDFPWIPVAHCRPQWGRTARQPAGRPQETWRSGFTWQLLSVKDKPSSQQPGPCHVTDRLPVPAYLSPCLKPSQFAGSIHLPPSPIP